LKKKVDKTIDVLSHVLVPEMSVISADEKAKVLKKYGISESQLPVLPDTDPAAVALKASAGDLVKIKRTGETGEYVGYRIVVSQ
jgi:DNA-directed RNA polymerase I, II, and III subunit RPABC1